MEQDQDKDKPKVVSMIDRAKAQRGGRGKAASGGAGAEKPKLAELYLAIANVMNRHRTGKAPTDDNLPAFPRRFYTIEPQKGAKLILEEQEDKVLQPVSESYVVHTILKYIVGNNLMLRGYTFEPSHAKRCAEFWVSITDAIPEPKSVAWADEDVYTYRRLPWRLETDPAGEHTKLFNELLGRILVNREALMAWIGSLFFEDSYIQQFIYLYGEGGEGKGALTRFLRRVFGDAFKALTTPLSPSGHVDKFWSYGLIGKRIGCFSDFDSTDFLKKGFTRSLLGGDPQPVERKNQMAFDVELRCKFMFTSNRLPQGLSSQTADMRRAIYCEIAKRERRADDLAESIYEDALYQEGGYFLSECIAVYERLCPNHGPIPAEAARLEDVVSGNEEKFADVARKFFVAVAPVPHLTEQFQPFVPSGRMIWLLEDAFKSSQNREAVDFKAYLRRTLGTVDKGVTVTDDDGKVTKPRRWLYLRETTPSEKRDLGYADWVRFLPPEEPHPSLKPRND